MQRWNRSGPSPKIEEKKKRLQKQPKKMLMEYNKHEQVSGKKEGGDRVPFYIEESEMH